MKSIMELFVEQAHSTPETVAVACGSSRMNYRELDERTDQLAQTLRARGVGPETIVGVCVQRSVELVIGLMGILKAGGAYLPLDIGYPPDRLKQMAEDTALDLVLTIRDNLPVATRIGSDVLLLDDPEGWIKGDSVQKATAHISPHQLAYVIYTSGSTGKPKGVAISRANLLHSTEARLRWYREGVTAYLLVSSFAFDSSVAGLYWTLATGGTLHLAAENEHRDVPALLKLIERNKITHLLCLPSLYREMLDQNKDQKLRSLRVAIVAGEVCPTDLIELHDDMLPETELFNEYGPTEGTVWATVHPHHLGERPERVPIGKTIPGTGILLLNHQMEEVPAGQSGELYITGGGVARGYLNQADLTAERFVPNPGNGARGERIYRTGDLGRCSADGMWEYLGRMDHQVKIRGYRIELGEIEAVLSRHPEIRQAAVEARGDDPNKKLVAYVVANAADGIIPRLRQYLIATLPQYMMPSTFVLLDELPIGPNGKLDRTVLSDPIDNRAGLTVPYVEPQAAVEKIIAQIWEELLHVDQIGLHDNFFDLGGHSLLATQFIARLSHTLRVNLEISALFENPTVAEVATLVGTNGTPAKSAVSITPVSRDGDLRLTFSQERVWFLEQLQPGNLAYNYQSLLRFDGLLRIEALEQALHTLICRHEILRTTFHDSGGFPVQVIHDPYTVQLPVIDLVTAVDPEKEAQHLIEAEIRKPFDLQRLPLIHWVLFRLTPTSHLLLHKEHHMLHDGWSFNLLLQQVFELYKAYTHGTEPSLPEMPIQFADFASWQRQWMEGEECAQQLDFWKRRLANCPELLALPWDHPRPVAPSFQGHAPRIDLSLDLCEALRRESRKQNVTLFMSMFTAFVVLLHRLCGASDICVGSGVADRRWKESESLLGMVVNIVVLRSDLSGNPQLDQVLRQVKRITLDAYANQDIPFDKVVEAVQPTRDLSINPIFQVMFSFHDSPIAEFDLPDTKVGLTEGISNGSAKWDLNIVVIPRAEQKIGHRSREKTEGITVSWEYSSDLFQPGTMERWLGLYQNILRALVSTPEQRIDDLPLLSERESREVISLGAIGRTVYPREKCVHELFEEQAKSRPEAPAAIYGERSLSYSELNGRANRLARYLRKCGAGPDATVGICIERSLEMIIGLLAILKAGAAFVPINPDYPLERKQLIIRETGMRLILAGDNQSPLSHESDIEILNLDQAGILTGEESQDNLQNLTDPDNLAYVLYTSGSTGKAKGIAVPHRGVVRLVKNTNYVKLGPQETILQFAPLSFDASTFEIWGSLLNGGRLVIMSVGEISLRQIGNTIRENGITSMWLTAGLFHLMVDHQLEDLTAVRQLVAGGDVLSVSHVTKFLQHNPKGKLINGYGPTENTTFTCCHAMREAMQFANSVPIGSPISNTEVYVLDGNMQPVPEGVVGELYAGGDGLARGYLNDPELTAEKFGPNPFGELEGERLYQTGDLVRYRAQGLLEFVGRVDDQVKIRGFRIEPSEIQAVLEQHRQVKQTVVMTEEDNSGEKRLVACVVAEETLYADGLFAYLRDRLPEYMVPAAIVMLNEIPLTENGKVNRPKLIEATRLRDRLKEESSPEPRNEVERVIAEIWMDVLGLQRIGIHDNFFDLGGQSLRLMHMVARVKRLFGAELQLRDVFESPTVSAMSRLIFDYLRQNRKAMSPIIRMNSKEYPVSLPQRGLWFVQQLRPENGSYNIPLGYHFRGRLHLQALQRSVNEIIRRHEILRTRFVMSDEELKQVVEPELRLTIASEDLTSLIPNEQQAVLLKRMQHEGERPFDLEQLPLLRLRVFQLGSEEFACLACIHHMIADGWSMRVFFRELGQLYNAYVKGAEPLLPELEVQYGDYAVWQRQRVNRGEIQEELKYWASHLADVPQVLELPTDYLRPELQSYRGGTEHFTLTAEMTADLKRLSREAGVTLYMTLLAAFATLLHHYNGQPQLLIGSPVANRMLDNIERVIGLFANMLVMHVNLEGNPRFSQLLEGVRELALAAYTHQELPFEALVEHLNPVRDASRNPLVQVVFTMLEATDLQPSLSGVKVSPLPVDLGTSKFDLYLEMYEKESCLNGRLVFDSALFSRATARTIDDDFVKLLALILRNKEAHVSEILQMNEERGESSSPVMEARDLEGTFLL